jgi:hypothetical protein
MHSVTETCGQTWAHNKTRKNIHINMCPEAFNFLFIAERIFGPKRDEVTGG